MAADFDGASTQYLNCSAPTLTLAPPFTVGMWVNLRAVGSTQRALFSMSDTGTASNWLLFDMTTGEQLSMRAIAGGSAVATNVTTALTVGTWNFGLARFITASNRRLACLFHTGLIQHANNGTSRAPTGMDTITIGANVTSTGVAIPWDGLIGEYWITQGDVGLVTTALPDDLIRQLAYGGPFSVPHIADKIFEYRSFRQFPTNAGDDSSDVFVRNPQTWENVNGVTIGPHPPLPYWFVKPGQVKSQLIV